MLCYRCGSYSPDEHRQCDTCGQSFVRAGRPLGSPSATTVVRRMIPPVEAGAIIADRYEVLAPIDPGTCGWVLRAVDRRNGDAVAIKLVSSNLLQTNADRDTFIAAVAAVRAVQHPNVAPVLDVGQDAGAVFYVTPLYEGLTLRRIIDLRLEKQQLFTTAELLPLLGQLADAAAALASMGGHGALRPSNIIVMPELLKCTGAPHHAGLPRRLFVALLSQYGAVDYVAPEARRDDKLKLSPSADVYSLGVMLAEMLTGERYAAERPHAFWDRDHPALHSAVARLLRQALAPHPEARFVSAAAWHAALASIVTTGSEVTMAAAEPMAPEDTTPEGRDALVVTPAEPTADASEADQAAATQADALALALAEADVDADADADTPAVVVAQPPEPLGDDSTAQFAAGPGCATPGRREPTATQQAHVARERSAQWALVASAAVIVTALAALVTAMLYVKAGREPLPMPARRAPAAAADRADRATPASLGEPADPAATDTGEPQRAAADGSARARARARARAHPSGHPAGLTAKTARSGAKMPSARRCPRGMVAIEAASAVVGSAANDPMRDFGDREMQRVKINHYCIDSYEFPNNRGELPAQNIGWDGAKQACEAAGKRLCTESEWEHACGGPANARFPFGRDYAEGRCNVAGRNDGAESAALVPAGALTHCRSVYGVFDLSGNVAEWTASRWSDDVGDRVVKGGAADQAYFAARCAARTNEPASTKQPRLGFRCCADRQ